MTERFDRFTDSSRRVFAYALEQADRGGTDQVLPEHLLIGTMREDADLASSVLATGGLEFGPTLTAVVDRLPAPTGHRAIGPSLSPAVQRIIELAVDEMRRRGDDRVAPRHLLVGVARQGDESQSGFLHEQGLTADSIRDTALDFNGPSQAAAEGRIELRGAPGTARPTSSAAPERFDKFTERARKVLQLAQEDAQRFNHNYIGTEHLLLGLVREGEGIAAKVLANLGVDVSKVRNAVESIIGRGERTVTGNIGLTPRAKKVIELSVEEARRLNHNYIGTEHLLLGLVREGEGIAAGVLESLGVSLDKVRQQVNYVLSQSSGASATSSAQQAAAEPRSPTVVQLDAVLAALPEVTDEVAYRDVAAGPGYACGIVRFLPRDTPVASQITHARRGVVCHVLGGTGRLRIGDEIHEVKAGTICHIPALTPHDFAALEGPLVMFVASIDLSGPPGAIFPPGGPS